MTFGWPFYLEVFIFGGIIGWFAPDIQRKFFPKSPHYFVIHTIICIVAGMVNVVIFDWVVEHFS